jgi:hypothetical protein
VDHRTDQIAVVIVTQQRRPDQAGPLRAAVAIRSVAEGAGFRVLLLASLDRVILLRERQAAERESRQKYLHQSGYSMLSLGMLKGLVLADAVAVAALQLRENES